ncbi:MAG: 4-hydroxy-3-methylbut-2-en-1-yl diphosphate synthase [Dysgonamonadaceae bacterium]|nr:4-hydroxy-3-methylbut-2-en-1-yl diphosphate synthase [Dysgonamonadaceae bacterium]
MISDPFNYKRRSSSPVQIGRVPLGGTNPIRIQSMTNTSTMDTEASIAQCLRIIDAGADYVRLTAQGVREAENLQHIHAGLRDRGVQTPLVADIHFNPKAAEAAAQYVEKVRINPGNFVDSVKTFKTVEYTDESYAAETARIRTRLLPLLDICRQHHTALRIGVNHGSLSDRIMSRYGDTPAGMVESCMEFLRILVAENFPDVVISIKSSNTVMMVKTVHLLVRQMEQENMKFPLHLGVTEAGDGEDGRIKSAVGIGALLADGIGDTIRVSLSEDPEAEIPVARKLVDYIREKNRHAPIEASLFPAYDPTSMDRRPTYSLKNIGGDSVPIVISDLTADCENGNGALPSNFSADYAYIGSESSRLFSNTSLPNTLPLIADYPAWKTSVQQHPNTYPLFDHSTINAIETCEAPLKFIRLSYLECSDRVIRLLQHDTSLTVLLETSHANGIGEQRAFFHTLLRAGCQTPVVICRKYRETSVEDLQLKAAVDFGTLFLDGFGNGIMLSNTGNIPIDAIHSCMFGILQATRLRISKTEYISCPGCGRTLFDLQTTIARIKQSTAHLKGLKIGVMGCIVNGPGEMADADYGYVGSAVGKVDLYKNKHRIEKNIPAEQAVDKLVQLIKKYGDWKELKS